KVFHNKKIASYAAQKGVNLLEFLISKGYFINADCGGKGTCGKCRVKLISGNVNAEKDKDGFILSCKAQVFGDIEIELQNLEGTGLTSHNFVITHKDNASGYGVAVDIGTTTLAFYLMNLSSGKEIDSYSCLNPQGVFGGDVISRIAASKNGKLSELNKLIVNKVAEICNYFIKKHGIKELKKVYLCGNTTMIHLFSGVDASPLGQYPFTPVFTDLKEFRGVYGEIEAWQIILLPCVSAYIGSDVVTGIIATNIDKSSSAKLLVDIGTNGELVLSLGGELFCASTAAGPAFEGANITCGMGGVSGAIDSVTFDGSKINYTVIGEGQPKGICGSGLIDIIALMFEYGVIDESGLIVKSDYEVFAQKTKNDSFYITDDVFISQKDVREFQLAKSAICSGIKTIIKTNGLKAEDISEVFISGGLGFYINKHSAVKVGLIPPQFIDKLTIAGNSAGGGTKLCLLSEKELKRCINVAKKCKNIELAESSVFMEEYINNMGF
ncbi:MAG: ASKHA domain-containing protein, partial [Clostridia bacterium]|nr:ASKHA domain-containing protein [Clostridia bacterium]